MEKWLQEAADAIALSSPQSAVYIGCDSVRFKQSTGKGKKPLWFARYSTVVVVHNNVDSIARGCSLFHDTIIEKDTGDILARMMREAELAITSGVALRDVIGDRRIELHLDINPNKEHRSSIAVQAAQGWATGMGFEAKVKPDAWAATHAADHVARH